MKKKAFPRQEIALKTATEAIVIMAIAIPKRSFFFIVK